jgi:hypothetical protein
MIVSTFDNGWGPEWSTKKFEQQILSTYLEPLANNKQRWAMINSTWYTDEYHQQTLPKLADVDGVVLVSMLDASIPQPSWYSIPTRCVGYYPGTDEIDFWALIAHQHINTQGYCVDQANTIDTAYMCLNRKPHWHRRRLYARLEAQGLLDAGFVSLGGDNSPAQRLLQCDSGGTGIAPNAGQDQHGINNDIASLGHSDNWARHFVNIVTETVFDIKHHHFVSEKIYKPIIGARPFLVYASDGATQWLSQHGFQNYVTDFGDICDLNLADPNNISMFLTALVQAGPAYWQSKFVALQDKIMYNKFHFDTYVKQQQLKINQRIQCQI